MVRVWANLQNQGFPAQHNARTAGRPHRRALDRQGRRPATKDVAVKYEDSIERSTELLRKALPMMSRQAAALHPVSYAVWYEYMSQANPALRGEVDDLIARHGQLDEASIGALFRRHVAEMDPAAAQRVTDGFQRVLHDMAESAALAGDQTAKYGHSLSRLSDTLDADASPMVAQVLQNTRDMQGAVAQLKKRLDDSQREIETLRQEVQRARHESMVDALTGRPNRRAFDQRLAQSLAAHIAGGQAARPCLVMGDIDHFKRINDSFGHSFGDQVLRAVAQVLQACVSKDAMVARTGGEEFALLLPAAALAEAERLADHARRTVAASRVRRKGSDEVIERVTLSFGVTAWRDGEAAREFIDRADRALYASKSGGRDRVTVLAA
jgi:diguanylate cyclase